MALLVSVAVIALSDFAQPHPRQDAADAGTEVLLRFMHAPCDSHLDRHEVASPYVLRWFLKSGLADFAGASGGKGIARKRGTVKEKELILQASLLLTQPLPTPAHRCRVCVLCTEIGRPCSHRAGGLPAEGHRQSWWTTG